MTSIHWPQWKESYFCRVISIGKAGEINPTIIGSKLSEEGSKLNKAGKRF